MVHPLGRITDDAFQSRIRLREKLRAPATKFRDNASIAQALGALSQSARAFLARQSSGWPMRHQH
jgi:hypothetical protein